MAPEPFDKDYLHFPLLQAIDADLDAFKTLQPKDVDAFGVEIQKAFQRCSVPETTVSTIEREVNESMLGTIRMIESRMTLNGGSSSEAGATLLLFRRVLLTPANMTALLKMADPHVRSGAVRCRAIWLLNALRQVMSVWKIRLEDGTSFAMGFIQALAKGLDPTIQVEHSSHNECHCNLITWGLLPTALVICKDSPCKVVDILLQYDWPAILQRQDACVVVKPDEKSFYDVVTYFQIHACAVRLLAEDPNSTKARDLLRSLGNCNILFRRILDDVVTGKIWSVSGQKFFELAPTINTLTAMLNCLVVVPDDHELDALVRRAKMCIMETFMTCMLEGNTMADRARTMGGMQSINLFLELVDDACWQELKHETLDSRWARFRATYLSASPESLAKHHKAKAKKLKKMCQDGLKIADLSGGEMCANCHVLETSLQNGLTLSKCARCQQIKYCSRTCQGEHWKRAHKKLCAKIS
jgi:hypothetical protein